MNDLNTNIINVSGKNIECFFQNLITNDIKELENNNVLYTALLSPQGKYLNDFFIIKLNNHYLIECNESKRESLINELKKYDIRSDIKFDVSKKYKTKVIKKNKLEKSFQKKLENTNFIHCSGYAFYEDPRSKNFLIRFIFEENNSYINKLNFSNLSEVELERIKLKIPNSDKDLEINKSFILNYNFANINALSFSKGCFIGQENTARQKYRGTQKYSLETIKLIEGKFPEINEDIFYKHKKIGTMKSFEQEFGLCLLRNDILANNQKEIRSDKNTLFYIV